MLEIPEGYERITEPTYILSKGDKFSFEINRIELWYNCSVWNTYASRHKIYPSRTYIRPINRPAPAPPIIKNGIQIQTIPAGYKLVEDEANHIVTAQDLFWRPRWGIGENYHKVTVNFNSSIGRLAAIAKTMLYPADAFFITPVPRFTCDKPFPFGY